MIESSLSCMYYLTSLDIGYRLLWIHLLLCIAQSEYSIKIVDENAISAPQLLDFLLISIK